MTVVQGVIAALAKQPVAPLLSVSAPVVVLRLKASSMFQLEEVM